MECPGRHRERALNTILQTTFYSPVSTLTQTSRAAAAFLFGAGCLLAPDAAALVTLDIDAGPGLRNVLGLDSQAVPAGVEVLVGGFADGFDPASAFGNPALLAASWTTFGTLSTTTIFGQPGRFAGSVTGDTTALLGDVVWLWIRQANAAPLLPDWSNLSAHGVFSSTASHWVFPDNDTFAPLAALTSSEINAIAWGSVTTTSLHLATIPEPSLSGMLAGTSALLALLRRRKHARANPASKELQA